jgi:UDP:flavonoid glycosyltransferase YjiC (YdhE family)
VRRRVEVEPEHLRHVAGTWRAGGGETSQRVVADLGFAYDTRRVPPATRAIGVSWSGVGETGRVAVITLVTMGSWGDLFPFVGLGRALVTRGHEVRLAASPASEDVVVGAGVPFAGVGRRFGFEELRRHPELLRRVPFGLRHALGRLVFDQIDELTDDLRDAMAGADLVVTHPAQVAAQNVAEHLGVRRLVATVFPGMIPSSTTVPGGTPVGPWPGWAGRAANRMAWRGARVGTAVLFDRPINRHRRRLGLPGVRAALLKLPQQAEVTIVMASPHVIEPPPDWPGSVTVTSFVAWDGAAERPLDDSTRAFLDAGAPPVLVTLGSNGAILPDDFFDQAARLVIGQGLRALVVTGPGGRSGGVGGLDDVHVTGYVAFSEVMQRCRATVYHAGVGTTVAAIIAGIPQVVVPKASTNPTPQRASKF